MWDEIKVEISKEQKLIDLVFEIALTISDKKFPLRNSPNEEKGQWIAEQLRKGGFDTNPVGASWGVLKR